ncbi:MAG TPA: glycine cleavage system aminomethyltransferase GcvT [Bradyrhizobium sp.]|jgi:aminomethyltransferase|nr:glycine cleavage system aminomethyltransferase GcvT [Bradyrhizobium sp.]
MAQASEIPLKHTPLYEAHVALGARMVPFAGYEMPVQYPPGIIKEHLHTRAAAGLFDVSHMGQIALRSRSGRLADAARALETLVPADIVGLGAGRQRYSLFTNEEGGVLDDLMVANLGDHFRLIVNAARRADDEAHLRAGLAAQCSIEPLPAQALLALQGPRAEGVLVTLSPEIAAMRFMDVRRLRLCGADCIISRSGYTGEDGFEISIANDAAAALWSTLLQNATVMPVGLGARDSLRLEAGLCLYGSDLDATTTPVAAALEWSIARVRRRGGERCGGFPGAANILAELEHGAARRRIGLKPEGRAPVRGGALLFGGEENAASIGAVTSGGFGVSLGVPIAMGYVPVAQSAAGTRFFAELRGRREALQVCGLPFVPPRYRRS